MRKSKTNKFISNIMTLTMIFMMVNTYVYATIDSDVRGILVDITEVFLTIAGLVCLGKFIHIGILYMTSSAVDKSNAKSAFLPWLIGTIVCFGAASIGSAIINLLYIGDDVLSY